jgi:beta-aspartyl-peptidase (threonine type)
MADDAYFYTQHRYDQLLKAREEGIVELDHTAGEQKILEQAATPKPMGTVGVVACDENGNVAAATSTGGMTNKKFGRVGDTPLIGLGTYADDLCAVSCTGHGEYFMLGVTAYDVSARMRYLQLGLEEAAAQTIERLTQIKGDGGLIAVDTNGNVTMPFNSEGMYRGCVSDGREFETHIYS